MEIVDVAGQDAQPRDRLGRGAAGNRDRGRRALSIAARGSGERIVTLASLTLTPLRLDAVDARSIRPRPRSRSTGTAYVCDRAAWAPLPDDLPLATALERLRRLRRRLADPRAGARADGTVCVLGAGHARQAGARGRPRRDGAAGPWSRSTSTPTRSSGSPRSGSATSASPPTCATRSPRSRRLRGAGAPPADLTVVVVNATGCEPTAILLTADGGTVLFFSMATSFSAAALAARRDRLRRADAGRQRLRARPRRLRPRPRAPLAGRCARRSACPSGSRRERATRAPRADALARPRRARPRQPHRRPHLPRGGPRRVPEAPRDPPRRVRGRALLGQLPAARSIRPSRR